MRMKLRDKADLNWLPPSLDYMSGLVIGNQELIRKHTLSESELNFSTNVSLNVKVNGGQNLTTPPKVVKQTKSSKNDDQEKSKSHNQQKTSHDTTESLLSSLGPYINYENLNGLDEETVRKLLIDHPELIETAREYDEVRKNRNHDHKEMKNTKHNDRRRESKTKSNGSENFRYEDRFSSKTVRLSHVEVLMEDGIPFKSWFFLFVLIGASIFQMRKIILEPVKCRRNTKKNGKIHSHETFLTLRRKPKKKRSNNKKKKQSNKQSTKASTITRQRNNSLKSVPIKQTTSKETSTFQNNRSVQLSNPDPRNLETNSKIKKKQMNVQKTVRESNTNKQDQMNNYEDEQYDQNIHDLKIRNQDNLNENCEEDTRAFINALGETSSSSEGEWHIASYKHKKNKYKNFQESETLFAKIGMKNEPKNSIAVEKNPNNLKGIEDSLASPGIIANSIKNTIDLIESNGRTIVNTDKLETIEHEKSNVLKIIVKEGKLEHRPNHEMNYESDVIQKDSRDKEKPSKTLLRDVVTSYIDTQNDAALAMQLQREEDLLFATETLTEENWTKVTTKKGKKSSAFASLTKKT